MAFFCVFSFSVFRVKSGRGEADPLCDHAGPDRASTPILFLFFHIFVACVHIHPWLAQTVEVEGSLKKHIITHKFLYI